MHRYIHDDIELKRLERVRRALAKKCPKLLAARVSGRMSILAVESNDIALANPQLVGDAVRQALAERDDGPDIIVGVETSGLSFYGWVIENRTNIPLNRDYYTEAEVGFGSTI